MNFDLFVTKSIQAIVFVFRPQKDRDTARVGSCTGWVRHAVRFGADGAYEFTFTASLSDGDAEASLLSSDKQPLFTLSRRHPAERIELGGKESYYLRWNFEKATGTCALRWTAAGTEVH